MISLLRLVVSTLLVLPATMCLLVAAAQAADNASEPKVKVDDNSFKCITEMTPVRHFYVDNLLGNVEATAAVAKAGKGDYPDTVIDADADSACHVLSVNPRDALSVNPRNPSRRQR